MLAPPADLSPDPARLAGALRAADPAGRCRTLVVTLDGQRYWIKRPERLNLRLRLQKGNAASAFARERAALRSLAGRGLPVARLVADAPDFLAVADCGTPLRRLLLDPACPPAERCRAARAGGAALAALHAAGIAHGRPDLRDICWDGANARLIDFERFQPPPSPAAMLRDDLFILVFAAVVALGAEAPETRALLQGYRAAAPPEPWQAAARRARRLSRLAPLLRLLAPLDGRRGEIAAVRPSLRLLTDPP